MGEISKQLHVKLKAMASNVLLPRSSKGRKPSPQTPDIERLIEEGIDPVHAAYIFVHHIASVFAENVSQLPEMRAFTKEVGKAEDEYLPEGPPMSPLTRSYFTSWAFFDHRIGKTTDTLASCLIDANDIIWMNPDQLHALKEMNESRMGIYEHRAGRRTMCGCGNSSPTGMLSATSPRATGGKQVNSGMSVSCRHWSPSLPPTTLRSLHPTYCSVRRRRTGSIS